LAEANTAHNAHTALAHHFDNLEQQREAGSLGMWVFLVTEVMFFGGFFVAYIVYRLFNYQAFAEASSHLNWKLGALNTAVLISSSLTMALAVYCAQVGKRKSLLTFMSLTILLGLVFLVVKFFEYGDKFRDNLVPGHSFVWEGNYPRQAELFYSIYFGMTGLHALHMVIGIGVMLVLLYNSYRSRYTPEYHAPVELTGLYWHFVDIVWIFLFPLLYLIGAHQTH
jgi:cytochrome c oxidase subunit 3